MKPEEQSWHEYISECSYDSDVFESLSKNELDNVLQRQSVMRELHDKYGKYLIESYKPVYLRNFPKKVVKIESPKFANAKFDPYSFKLQCQVTGDISKWIKRDDYHIYGIFPNDADKPGGYEGPQKIPNKLEPIKLYYDKAIKEMMDQFNAELMNIRDSRAVYQISMRQQWFNRYSEYLNSWEWRNKRIEILKLDGKKCTVCDATQKDATLQVHHISYQNVGDENTDDLVTMCESCHKHVHSVDKARRAVIEFNAITSRPQKFCYVE